MKTISALRYPLNDILGTKASVSILRELFLHGRTLSSSDLRRRTGLSHKAVTMTLDLLDQYNTLIVHGSQRSRLFEINIESPFFISLKKIFETESIQFEEIVRGIRKIINETNLFEIHSTLLYGSVARFEDSPESDLDLLIIIKNNAQNDDIHKLENKLNNELGYLETKFGLNISLVVMTEKEIGDAENISNPWWQNVKQDAITISGHSPYMFELI